MPPGRPAPAPTLGVVDIRRVVAAIGRTLIAAGVLILLFVAYQLWGTGLAEARSQDDLRASLNRALELATTQLPTTGVTLPGGGGVTPTVAPPPPEGEAIAIIRIPRIGVDKAVVEGVEVDTLKKGPGHYPGTPMPGQPGNAAIAGHRTTYGAPFYRLDELAVGDEILVTSRQGRFRYEVTETKVVSPRASEVLNPTDDNRLTLTTCNPRFSAKERLIVVARLTGEPADAPPAPPTTVPPLIGDPGIPAEEPGEGAAESTLDTPGLSGEGAAKDPAIMWATVAAAIWLLAWLLSRRIGRVLAYGLGLVPFLVALFLFFENFARLLPANV